MNESIALLISRCPVVIEQVKGVALGVPRVQIEVCSAQNASGRVQQSSVGLILAHLSADEEMGITRLLWSVAQARRPQRGGRRWPGAPRSGHRGPPWGKAGVPGPPTTGGA